MSFAGTNYAVGAKFRRQQVQIAVVGATVEISLNGQLLRTHPARHDPAKISGASDNRWVGPMGRITMGRLLNPFISQTISSFTVNPNRSDLDALTALIENGAIRPVIDSVYALSDITDAVRHAEAGHTRGKIVIATDPSTAAG